MNQQPDFKALNLDGPLLSEVDLAVPFGSNKEPGFGSRDKGLAARDQYPERKAIWIQCR